MIEVSGGAAGAKSADSNYDHLEPAVVGQETQRLDFRRLAIRRPKVAHLACAFANANGGIIVIGFDDPKPGVEIVPSDTIDISDKEITALAAAINARVYPPLPMEIHGYRSAVGTFLILRVARSEVAPTSTWRRTTAL